ncbi:MAG: hypothetical protein FWE82_00145 [Defluviitaleaceae bacterium]|nr:hypothetical protein [Defluviitaleaceae bacterium]
MGDIPVKEIGELLDEVSDKVPKLISGLLGTLYSGEAGENMGFAVGNFYKALVESGIPNEDAVSMARDYMLSMRDMVKNTANLSPNMPAKETGGENSNE